ncbi:hypothetical protein ABTO99_18335, partial [Acinetobacter baumannii]
RYGASKKHDLAASAEKLFAGDILVEAETKDRATSWLPDAMRFVAVDDAASPMIEPDGEGTDESGIVIDLDAAAAAEPLDDDGTEAFAAAA